MDEFQVREITMRIFRVGVLYETVALEPCSHGCWQARSFKLGITSQGNSALAAQEALEESIRAHLDTFESEDAACKWLTSLRVHYTSCFVGLCSTPEESNGR